MTPEDKMAMSKKIEELSKEIARLRKLGRTKREPISGFGGALQELREEMGLGIRELASRIGVSAGRISGIETTIDANPGWHTIRKIAKGLNMTPQHLIESVNLWESVKPFGIDK